MIRAFAGWQQARAAARLVLVGTPMSAEFGAMLSRLADELAPGAVTFETGLSAGRLWERYRSAAAFLCLSEHEGFCIPLLEAFHFGVPVIARDAGAIGEVVADAGVLVEPQTGCRRSRSCWASSPAIGELREELAARGARRLSAFVETTASRCADAPRPGHRGCAMIGP